LADAVQLCRNGGGRNVAERIRQKTLRNVDLNSTSAVLERASTCGEPETHSNAVTLSPEATPSPAAPSLVNKPTSRQLHHLRLHGPNRTINIIHEIAPNWESLAYSLGMSHTTIRIVQRNHPQDVVGACEEMMSVWLEGREGVRRPLTWATLLEALKETGEFEKHHLS
jgi:hypothetical protein